MPTLPKPDYRGQFDGQVKIITKSVPTGKRFPWTPPGKSEPFWIPIKESRVFIEWVWDNRLKEWVLDSVWSGRRPSPNAGKVLARKEPAGSLKSIYAARQRKAAIATERAKRKGKR